MNSIQSFSPSLFSASELHGLLRDIEEEFARREKVSAFVNRIKAECQEAGLDFGFVLQAMSDLPGGGSVKRKDRSDKGKKKAIAKPVPLFQNKDGASWSGRGRMPLWLAELVNNNKSLAPYYVGPEESKREILAKYKA